jgi:molecular chaperone GrpE
MSKKGDKHVSDEDILATDAQALDAAADDHGSTSDVSSAQAEASVSQTSIKDERIEELTRDLQRLQAEFMNYKRREAAAKAELLNLAKRDVVIQLLPLLDNLDRALAHRPQELQDNAWAQGVESVAKQAGDSLKKLGVEKIESLGQPFDHNLHEAISMEDGDGDHDVVVEELQPGYKMGDVVIRHAMVRVGKTAEKNN